MMLDRGRPKLTTDDGRGSHGAVGVSGVGTLEALWTLGALGRTLLGNQNGVAGVVGAIEYAATLEGAAGHARRPLLYRARGGVLEIVAAATTASRPLRSSVCAARKTTFPRVH
jgi:hypothetical protein